MKTNNGNRHLEAVPFLDLVTPHCELEAELVAVFRDALRQAAFIGGSAVEQFEERFAEFCEAKYCVGVGSGTDALRFALIAAGVRPGDAVITVANTFIATTEAISQAGAVPEFVDVERSTSNMDPVKLGEFLESQCLRDQTSGQLISRRTSRPISAIVPVHLYGQMAAMDEILALAESNNLIVVEDACQAHGAEYFSKRENRWKRAGSVGHAAAFSFYPGKNLGACGEAGAVTTSDAKLAQAVRMLRDHGQAQKYYHDFEGYNGRLDAIQAGILTIKLAHLDRWNEMRRINASRYREMLETVQDCIAIPQESVTSRPAYHLYVVHTDDREALRAQLAKAKVGTGIHYPIPLHLQKAYEHIGYRQGDLPTTEWLSTRCLSLPMYPGLTMSQQKRVAEAASGYVKRSAAALSPRLLQTAASAG